MLKFSFLKYSFIRFLLVGVINTCVGLGVIYTLKYFFDVNDVAANAGGYSVGLVVSFILNSKWTFNYKGDIAPAVIRFILVFIVAYSANLLVVLAAINIFTVNSYIAQALGIPVYTLTFYFGSNLIAFRDKQNDIDLKVK